MSDVLLQRIKAHIVDVGGLLSAYTIRYYRWRDSDLNGAGNVALFKMAGTFGPVNHEAQQIDVMLHLLADPDSVRSADADMLAVVRYLRTNFEATGIYGIKPVNSYTGPTYLQNGRARFEMIIRCGIDDH